MNRLLFGLLAYTDGPLWRSFWNSLDWLAALGIGYGLGTGSAWLYHCSGYLGGRWLAHWLRRKNDRDLEALWRDLKKLTEEGNP